MHAVDQLGFQQVGVRVGTAQIGKDVAAAAPDGAIALMSHTCPSPLCLVILLGNL